MNLIAISINHRTAPVELREAVHLNEDEIRPFITLAKENQIKEGLILSTCNRTEIFGIPNSNETSHEKFQSLLLNFKPAQNITEQHFQKFVSRDAIKHLFSVATGIDSLLVGDNQVFKQVKDSFQIAEDTQFAGYLMHRIFDSAIRTGKRAISETSISEGAVTVSYAAVQLTEKIFSNLSKKSALVIGTGETGEIAAKHLSEKGIGSLAVTNRTQEKAEKLAQKLNAKVIPFSVFKDSIYKFDIIISATAAPEILISKDDVKAALKKRSNNSMILMDIAVPRDIDPETRKIDYVFYHDLDSLNIIVEQNLTKRKSEIPKVEKIIEEELETLWEWYNSLRAAPAIKDLRDFFEEIRNEEVEKNKNKFSSEDQEKLEIVTKRIINKILHHPTIELRKADEGSNSVDSASKIGIIRDLFGINSNKKSEKD
ncbi:MAG: glutamyl-tRNA reductase [Ignavibacteriaceae bacterium]|nr:glutamyl-tRNA reductase [Ignavibacteriaceae bacterium]MCU0414050.1 glutamyl-tRNA reductase [Ignavibacteriaceae bacterium]